MYRLVGVGHRGRVVGVHSRAVIAQHMVRGEVVRVYGGLWHEMASESIYGLR